MSIVDSGITRDGYTQVRRTWASSSPRAVILLVHGMSEHSGRYEHVGEELADAGFHVVAFDLRGHGMSGGTRSHVDDREQFLDDVEDHLAEVRRLGLPVVLMGHSMGGLIAARYAVSERPQPDLLILSAPALAGPANPPPAGLVSVLGATVPTLRLPPIFGVEMLSRDEEVQRAYTEDPLIGRRVTLGLVVQLFLAMREVEADLDLIKVPTMVVHGGDDALVPCTASELFEDRSDRVVYAGLRHEILNEPEWRTVTGDITAWLNRQLATGL